jgi:hypothetical protein
VRFLKTNSKAIEKAKNFFISKRFGALVPIAFECIRRGARHWLCECDCGKLAIVNGASLKNGSSKSCGCGRVTSRQLPSGDAAKNRLFDQYTNNARSRELTFSISREQFFRLVTQPCHYCGDAKTSSMLKRIPNLNGDFLYTGIDRVDSSKDYEIKNCVPCCAMCNRMKLDLSAAEFLEHAKKVARNST